MRVRPLGQEDTVEECKAIHSSVLAWRILWTEEPGGLQSIGSQRVGHNWSKSACTRAAWGSNGSLLFSSVQSLSHAYSLWPHGLQLARLPCPSPTPEVYSDSCPLSRWCRPTISSSVVPFSSCPQSFPASRSFPTSQLFASSGQSIGVSVLASVLPINSQDSFPLGCTGWTSLQNKGLFFF